LLLRAEKVLMMIIILAREDFYGFTELYHFLQQCLFPIRVDKFGNDTGAEKLMLGLQKMNACTS
jgi:hypothetical protein